MVETCEGSTTQSFLTLDEGTTFLGRGEVRALMLRACYSAIYDKILGRLADADRRVHRFIITGTPGRAVV